jgi:hypothetical protein
MTPMRLPTSRLHQRLVDAWRSPKKPNGQIVFIDEGYGLGTDPDGAIAGGMPEADGARPGTPRRSVARRWRTTGIAASGTVLAPVWP